MPFCSECGAKNTGGKFCSECGNPMGGATAPAPAKKAAPAPKPAAKVASTPKPSLGGGSSLSGHEDWELFNSKLAKVASGNGMKNLKKAFESTTNLPDQCGFGFFRIYAENVGNVGKGIMTEANIILQYKGPSAKAMAKVKFGGQLQRALDTLQPNKGFIEVLTTGANLTVDQVYDCWRPGSGSKVIQD